MLSRFSTWLTLWVPLLAFAIQCEAASFDKSWTEVDEALGKGLPKTALEKIPPILQAATQAKAWGEAARAIAQQCQIESVIQGGRPEERIRRLTQAITNAPQETRPVLIPLLGHWYWHYFQQNRWRIMQRTQMAAPATSDDFTTWPLARLFAEIDQHFTASLSNPDALKRIPVQSFDGILQKGTLPDTLRPTLYDFIAHEALKFYTSGEQAGARSEEAVDWDAASPVYGIIPLFGTAEDFARGGKVERRSQESPAEKALFLYRDLTLFHLSDKDPGALIDLQINRLLWANQVSVGDQKNTLYRAALDRLATQYRTHELASLALYHLGTALHGDSLSRQAYETARQGRDLHPESPGGKLCANLLAEIVAPALNVHAERTWDPRPNSAVPLLHVRYKNLTNVFLRAIPYEWEQYLADRSRWNEETPKQLVRRPPALQWTYPLPATADFRQRTQSLSAPKSLKPGFYLLLSSSEPSFSPQKGPIEFSQFWVSSLAMITVKRGDQLEGFVLDADSGEPLSHIAVSSWVESAGGAAFHSATQVQTDDAGTFRFPTQNAQVPKYVRATRGNESIATTELLSLYRNPPPEPNQPVYLFTDRSLYRPGQAIQYQGLSVAVDQVKDDYRVTPGKQVTLLMRDSNGREVGRAVHTCNAFGTFHGSFTAPASGLLGQMSLQPSGDFGVATWIRVEEYKRPTFQVTLPDPTTSFRLKEAVAMNGTAISYNGAPIQGATVRWRVTRAVRFPDWWHWGSRRSRWGAPDQVIAHGSATTGPDGQFKFEFIAKPDAAVSEKEDPIFTFRVHADVTDPAGETRSVSSSVQLGYKALELTLRADDWQTIESPVVLTVGSTTLDGVPLANVGKLAVHALTQPTSIPRSTMGENPFEEAANEDENPEGKLDPKSWPLGNRILEQEYRCGTNGSAEIKLQLPAGIYRATVTSKDRYGKSVDHWTLLEVLDPKSPTCPIARPSLVHSPSKSWQPGESLRALWGTGYSRGRALVEVEHRHQIIQRFWTTPGRTQQELRVAITEAMRGGLTLHVTQVRENRAYLESQTIDVPWSNKDLELRWEHFTSKLAPGAKETWTLVATPKSPTPGAPFSGELVATLYDKALDQFYAHHWPQLTSLFRRDGSTREAQFVNRSDPLGSLLGDWGQERYWNVNMTYRDYAQGLSQAGWIPGRGGRRELVLGTTLFSAATRDRGGAPVSQARWSTARPKSARMATAEFAFDNAVPAAPAPLMAQAKMDAPAAGAPPPPPTSGKDQPNVAPRRNLSETAFFYPHLLSDSNGVFRISFTLPEALTEWQFMGLAHDTSLRSGLIEAQTVSSKDLMVQPNPPRFLREGDVLEFTARVINQSSELQTGKVKLGFQLAMDDQPADALLGLRDSELRFSLPPKESHTFSWRLRVPDGLGFLKYRVIASSATLSDGEENYLPVLSRRVFLTESMPLPVRGPSTNAFLFTSLQNSAKSKSLIHEGLTVQMVSHPAWYAVLALPYLMEFPHECSEQTFNRFYANTLARHIAVSDPKIQSVFQRWRDTPALTSPMEKNQGLKSVLIEETPWVRDAVKESASRKRIGLLFETDRLNQETATTLEKLTQMQLADGRWPWFPGGSGNDYLTLYIATGFGRLRHLGVQVPTATSLRAWTRLDAWLVEQQRIAQKQTTPRHGLPSTIALYLYGRSFFLKEQPMTGKAREAADFWINEARTHWVETGFRQTQGHLALALKRFGDSGTAIAILNSLRERSVTDPEMGMYWRDTEAGWWWYQAPIETQALMIEAFDEVGGDAKSVDGCKTWLLKQKQTQNWKTTKGTADAVYALLLRGTSGLTSDALVQVDLGGVPVPSDRAEAGTGFYEYRIAGNEVRAPMAAVTVRKSDPGIAWGAVHWQYLEDLSQVKPHTANPLQLVKKLFLKKDSATGPTLTPIKEGVSVGDELVVRIELRVDRDMEYVHLKDLRGSGTEPVDVLSQYKYQDGLACYASTRDTASHFFIDYLSKGTYVFEYSSRVQHRGEYQTGVAEIQCLYAPEFNSHSESLKLVVQ